MLRVTSGLRERVFISAAQDGELPPPEPLQVHLYCVPLIDTDEALPLLQRLVDGAEEKQLVIAEPQTPFTFGVGVAGRKQPASTPFGSQP
jgi:hypothetical protein